MPTTAHIKWSPWKSCGHLAQVHHEEKDLLCLTVQELAVTIKVSTFKQENRGPVGRVWSGAGITKSLHISNSLQNFIPFFNRG